MATAVQLPLELINSSNAEKDNVVELAQLENWERLNQTIVSTDTKGNPVVIFGDSAWNIRHYFSQTQVHKHSFNFIEFIASPKLTVELKLIVYGWLFHKSSNRSKPAKPSSLIDRFSKLKKVYQYLQKNNHSSLAALANNKTEWSNFEQSLKQGGYSQRYLDCIFVALNHVLSIQEWLRKDFHLSKIQSVTLSRKLSSKVSQQTISIPERIADEIYGTAIELVESAYSYRMELAFTEKLIQQNYIDAKHIVDSKINTGEWNWLTNNSGEITDYHRYAQEIYKLMPQSPDCIIAETLKNATIMSKIKSHTFKHYYSILITASYICCGAFSGMRHSELGEITSKSYFIEEFDGRTFHMLQSKIFKFGEKNTTWVAAPIAQKAIELASELTKEWRLERANISPKLATDVIWLSRLRRSKKPTFANWTFRLKNFCKQFKIHVTPNDFKECVESNPNSLMKIKESVQTGKPWQLTPHQFRRTLAFYTIRHRLGTTISLKQQYKHLYLQMTEWYAEGGALARLNDLTIDNKLQEFLDTIKHEETTNKIFNFVHSSSPLSGSHGKAIVAMRDNVPHIYSSWDIIYQSVKSGNLSLHGTLHSYCKNGYNCDMAGIINPAFCVDCSSGSSIIDEENAKWWQTRHKELTSYLTFNTSASISVYSHCITQIRAAELVMRDFGMPFVEFNPKIEIIES